MDQPLDDEQKSRAARRFYSRFFLRLDVLLLALLALLWILNHYMGQ